MPEPHAGGSTPPTSSAAIPERGQVIDMWGPRMPAPADPGTHGAGPGGDPDERLAVIVQSLYGARGRTLTDPATGEAFDIALEFAILAVDSSEAQGDIPAEGHRKLRGILEKARDVPGLL